MKKNKNKSNRLGQIETPEWTRRHNELLDSLVIDPLWQFLVPSKKSNLKVWPMPIIYGKINEKI